MNEHVLAAREKASELHCSGKLIRCADAVLDAVVEHGALCHQHYERAP